MIETLCIKTPVGILKISGEFLDEFATVYNSIFIPTNVKIEEEILPLDSSDKFIFKALSDYFERDLNRISAVKLCFKAETVFKNKVLNAIKSVPFGQCITYKDIAEIVESPSSYRAVALACKNNPIQFFIPCHRVIRSDASLGGYQAGQEIKKKLLYHEMSLFFYDK